MNVKNCRNCGKLFNYLSGPSTCPNCREEVEAKFREVKEYIRNNNGVGIHQVAKECNVDKELLRQWLRDERLQLIDGGALNMTCDSCGNQISGGRYCDRCKSLLTQKFQNVMDENKSTAKPEQEKRKTSAKMRFLSED